MFNTAWQQIPAMYATSKQGLPASPEARRPVRYPASTPIPKSQNAIIICRGSVTTAAQGAVSVKVGNPALPDEVCSVGGPAPFMRGGPAIHSNSAPRSGQPLAGFPFLSVAGCSPRISGRRHPDALPTAYCQGFIRKSRTFITFGPRDVRVQAQKFLLRVQ